MCEGGISRVIYSIGGKNYENGGAEMRKPKIFRKAKGAYKGNFIKLPSNLKYYVYHPKYKAEMSYLYALIVDYFNEEFGYAWPSTNRLAMEYGKAEKTVRTHLNVLEELRLIQKRRGLLGNSYRPYEPLDEDEFFEAFPDAKKVYDRALRKLEAEKEAGIERKKELYGAHLFDDSSEF
ncbi:helix-turn-helix domain-containing protein [Bacillus cereus group sp. TH228LC]|uniref:helix-turn-helix domain-containing protein n=1 Tax=Bacillus cereus group sp. TH228LC TaxID=3018049 RepID=UPI0022E3BB46|nr:helix-turn-helix domain-containing protein [Bacillus cereus group sp. TH228LC]MDA1577574.1 helix-turn-helix domain-containing protein [Bacillus cereus group sp. TH228LC]